jgi:small-conductance mechanosensitive channel
MTPLDTLLAWVALPIFWEATALTVGMVSLLSLGDRWWPQRLRQLPREDWRRHTVFPAAFGFYCALLFGATTLIPAIPVFMLSGRLALLLLVWMLIPRVVSLLRDPYWIRAGEIVFYIASALILLPEARWLLEWLDGISLGTGQIRITVANLIQGIAVLVFSLYIGMGLASWIEKRLEQVNDLSPSLRVLLSKVLRVTLLVIAGVAGIDAIGIDLTILKFLGGGLGLGLGIGLQKVVSNLVSGFILLADRSIKPGDVIEVDETYGWINNLRARFVSVITRDGKEHLIPNEDLITHKVINWSFSNDNVRVLLDFGVAYGSDVHLVRKVALECVNAEPRILHDPKPVCFIVGFGDSSVDFQIRFWLSDPQNGMTNIRSAVYFRLWDAFKEHGIEIPFPQRDVHLKLD